MVRLYIQGGCILYDCESTQFPLRYCCTNIRLMFSQKSCHNVTASIFFQILKRNTLKNNFCIQEYLKSISIRRSDNNDERSHSSGWSSLMWKHKPLSTDGQQPLKFDETRWSIMSCSCNYVRNVLDYMLLRRHCSSFWLFAEYIVSVGSLLFLSLARIKQMESQITSSRLLSITLIHFVVACIILLFCSWLICYHL